MPKLRYIFEELVAANRGQKSIKELLCLIAGFGCRRQKGWTNSGWEGRTSSTSYQLRAEIERLRERIDKSETQQQYLRCHLRLFETH